MGSLEIENASKGYGDLSLFSEMRDRERRRFIYTPMDGLLSSPSSSPSAALSSKYGDGLSSTIGVSPSTLNHNDRILPLDANKNDYDWLLTPPTTPLFQNLDEEVPPNLSQRRLLTRTTSMMSRSGRFLYPQEPLHKTIVESPIRSLSPSTSTGSSTSNIVNSSRGRASSPSCSRRSSPTSRAARSNPSPLRPSSPYKHNVSPGGSRSGSISKSPTSRPLTPTPQCNHSNNTSPSSGSVNLVTGSKRMKGKSLSPQFHRWDSSLVDFPSEPPPNLRTSMSDRTIRRSGPQQPTGKEVIDQIRSNECHDTSISSSSGKCFLREERIVRSSKESVISSCGHIEKPKVSTRRARSELDDSILKRKSSPAKRELQLSGVHGGTKLSLPITNKQSGQQLTQRRSSQPMFRPLLSSAPVTLCRGPKHQFPSHSSGGVCSTFTGDLLVPPTENGVSNSDRGKEAANPEEHSSISQASELASSDTVENRRKSLESESDGDKSGSRSCIKETAAEHMGSEDMNIPKHPNELLSCQSEFPTLSPLLHHLEDHKHPNSVHDLIASKNNDSGVTKPSTDDTCAPDSSPNRRCEDKMGIEDPRLDLIKQEPIPETHLDGLPSKLLHHDVETVSCHMEMSMVEDIPKDIVVHEVRGRKHEGDLCKLATLKRSVTLEEATDTILFCNSIIQELVHTAAAMADKHEEVRRPTNALRSKQEFVTLFGFSGPEEKAGGQKGLLLSIATTRKRQNPAIAVQETKVQKQRMRMIHRQSEALTMKQSPTERIGNAVMGNLEQMRVPSALKMKSKQAKRVQSKCGCCMM